MRKDDKTKNQGSLCAPYRYPIDWQSEKYYQEEKLITEMERVFDICHGCRRCVNLCKAFPTLFDMIDSSETGELEPENHRTQYPEIVEQCYLCDRCYMNKCPYTPPHEWAVDFPHIMLQAKAQAFKKGKTNYSEKLLTNPELVGKIATIPVINEVVNTANKNKTFRKLLKKQMGVAVDAPIPHYQYPSLRKSAKTKKIKAEATIDTAGRVVLFTTCYCNYNQPEIGNDLIKIFEHNQIEVLVPKQQTCCGMAKFELGDFETIREYKNKNIKWLYDYVKQGYDIIAPVPSCVLMFKQELPLLFVDDENVHAVRNAFYDPFEYLMLRHKEKKLKTDFKHISGKLSYHVACHLEVQNMGLKTQQLLSLIPGLDIVALQRCSGHDGTYAIKAKFRANANAIGKPAQRFVDEQNADYYSSDCPLAAAQIQSGIQKEKAPIHPLTLLRMAYGL